MILKMEIQGNKIEIANFNEMRLENNKYKIKPNNYLMNEIDFLDY